MKARQILVATALLLVAFGLGFLMGSRFSRTPVRRNVEISARPAAHGAGEAGASNPPACQDVRNAGPLVGKNGCVTGIVLRVYSAQSGNTFLDFCQDYRTCPFTSVIFATDKNKFGDLESLQGKRVEIRGDIVSYQGRAEVIVRDPQQVRNAP
jgi:hypothetical protein